MTSIIDPTALLNPDRPNPTYPPAHTAMAGRLADGYRPPNAATPTKVSAVDLCGSSLVLTLAEGTDKAIAESPENYLVTVNGGNYRLPAGAIEYNPVAKTVTLSGIPFSRGDHVSVTVLGLWDRIKNIPGPAIICGVQIAKRSFPGRTLSLATAMVVALLILLLTLVL